MHDHYDLIKVQILIAQVKTLERQVRMQATAASTEADPNFTTQFYFHSTDWLVDAYERKTFKGTVTKKSFSSQKSNLTPRSEARETAAFALSFSLLRKE